MKWFKHITDAGESTSLNNMISEHGLIYYAHYFLLIELLAKRYDGENEEIELNLNVISSKVRIKFRKKLITFLQLLPNFFELSVQIHGESCTIFYPKLREIKDNHTTNLQVKNKKLASNLPLEEESKSKLKSKLNGEGESKSASSPMNNDVERFSLAYSNRFKEKYGKNPPFGQERVIMDILQKCEVETAIEAIDNFFNSKNSYYEHKAFTLNVMLGDIETLIVKANDKWGGNGTSKTRNGNDNIDEYDEGFESCTEEAERDIHAYARKLGHVLPLRGNEV